MASIWAILTRLEEPKSDLTKLQKLKLFNGKTLPGYNEDNVKGERGNRRRAWGYLLDIYRTKYLTHL